MLSEILRSNLIHFSVTRKRKGKERTGVRDEEGTKLSLSQFQQTVH
jgi:hypothetical protein